MSDLTKQARRFAEINWTSGITSGEWLDSAGQPVTGHPNTWVKLRYRFDNGRQVTLEQVDRDCLADNGIEPRWYHDAATGQSVVQSGNGGGV